MILATFRDATGAISIGAVNVAQQTILHFKTACRLLGRSSSPQFDSMLDLIEAGPRALESAQQLIESTGWSADAVVALTDVYLLAPVPIPAQIRDCTACDQHMRQAAVTVSKMRAERLKLPMPDTTDIKAPPVMAEQPIYYKGNRFSVVGHDADVSWPRYSSRLDYELEFGLFLSRRGVNISAKDAGTYIFGYTIFNDFSARDAQEIEMTGMLGPAKGKDFDTGNAMGPWIITPDDMPDPRSLTMTARVNGEEWSRSSSACFRYGFADILAFISRDETLYPGEFIGSGTVGNGCGLELDRWLSPGDVVELEVEGIGTLRNRVVREE